jgi:hypothetical protein
MRLLVAQPSSRLRYYFESWGQVNYSLPVLLRTQIQNRLLEHNPIESDLAQQIRLDLYAWNTLPSTSQE